MVSQTSIDLLTQLVNQTQANLTAYQEVLNALNTQLTTDQSQIDQAVSDQVTAALAPVQTSISNILNNAKTPSDPAVPSSPDDSGTSPVEVPADNEAAADTGVVAPEAPVEPAA
jgi:hypothetical protein